MSVEWKLTAHAHLACLEDDAVFLDLRTETYMCLPELAADLVGLVGGLAVSVEPDLAVDLQNHGLIEPCRGASQSLRPATPTRPATSAMPAFAERLSVGDMPSMIAALLDVARAYHGRPLTQVVAAAQRSRGARPLSVSARGDLAVVVSSVARWLPYAPLPPKCLLRSFLLLRSLHRHGLDATWVFGVTTWPFRAHCWLQVDDMVLDDDADRVMGFEPIMAV
jgi:hypothetical protein